MADLTVTAAKVGLVKPLQSEVHSFIAAAAITAGQAVYMTTSGTVGVADANAAGLQQIKGIALQSVGAGQAVDVLKKGLLYGFTLTSQAYDAPIFLSDTAGALADAAGTMTVPVGRVTAMADKDKTKVLYVDCKWRESWA